MKVDFFFIYQVPGQPGKSTIGTVRNRVRGRMVFVLIYALVLIAKLEDTVHKILWNLRKLEDEDEIDTGSS